MFWVFFCFSCRNGELACGRQGQWGPRGEAALQQLSAGVLGHVGWLQHLVHGDLKIQGVLVLSASPDIPVVQ